jgi:putative flavoprotein involved in K+ transport
VVGANTTGSELAALVARGGAAAVWVAMRTPPNEIKRRWRGVPLHAGALVLDRLPARVADRLGWAVQRLLVGDLREYGLPRSPMGMKTTVVERGMGPAVDDVGFVDALKSGRVELVGPVERLDGNSVVLAGGTRVRPDVVIAATGYRRGLEPLVGHLDVLLPDGRPRITGERTAPNAPGLYFIGFAAGLAGPLAQMRIDAKRIAKAAGSTG